MDTKPATIIEGMKELKLIEKKMEQNCMRILEYSSICSTELAKFSSEEVQRKEVQGLVQSNLDLATRYMEIKRAIERTNLATIVAFDKKNYTVSDLLVLKRKLESVIIKTYNSLSDLSAKTKQPSFQRVAGDQVVTVKQLYDEKSKYDALNSWHELFNAVTGRLEVVNATTNLIWD
jgi:hypothetical protein